MKNGLGNLTARDVDQLVAIVKNRLKRIRKPGEPSQVDICGDCMSKPGPLA